MKEHKGLIGLAVFMACLWALVVTTYGSQVATQAGDGKANNVIVLQTPTSCSSSSGTSGE